MAFHTDNSTEQVPDCTWFEFDDDLAGSDIQQWMANEQSPFDLLELDNVIPLFPAHLSNPGQAVAAASFSTNEISFEDWTPDWGNAVGLISEPRDALNYEAKSASQLHPTAKEHPARKRKPQPRIPADAKALFQEQYAESPYPAADQLANLAKRTGLSVQRVRNWFSNARSRHDDRTTSRSSQISVGALRVPLTRKSLEKLSEESQPGQLRPMEAWESSSLQSEAPSTSAIEAAADCDYGHGSAEFPPSWDSQEPSRTPSIKSSLASSAAGSLASASTGYSVSSRGSFASGRSTRSRRRGRRSIQTRRVPSTKEKPKASDSKPSTVYWCTFPDCDKSFTTHYEWVRHEESIHNPRQSWICCLDDDAFLLQDRCRRQSEDLRTFYRQDQFVQHLHAFHFSNLKHPSPALGCTKGSDYGCAALVKRWRRPAPPLERDNPLLHCGFCGFWLSTWEERRHHVSNHFKMEGKLKPAWWPRRAPQTLPNECQALEGPVRCVYCRETFHNRSLHPTCSVWSCRFPDDRSPRRQDDMVLFAQSPVPLDEETKFRVFGYYRELGLSYFFDNEDCQQHIYWTAEDFYRHLEASHDAEFNDRVRVHSLAEHFFREKQAAFQSVYVPMEQATVDLTSTAQTPPTGAEHGYLTRWAQENLPLRKWFR